MVSEKEMMYCIGSEHEQSTSTTQIMDGGGTVHHRND